MDIARLPGLEDVVIGMNGSKSVNNKMHIILKRCQPHLEALNNRFGPQFLDTTKETRRLKKLMKDDRGVRDTTTVVTFSVKIYYSKKFKEATPDVDGCIDKLIATSNEGQFGFRIFYNFYNKIFSTKVTSTVKSLSE